MGENSKIEWTDHTFNPWIGCTKVSEGCKNCYAETLDKRWGRNNWGPQGSRTLTSDANWKKPLQWNRQAEKEGRRFRVFCASLADVFEDSEKISPAWRFRLGELIMQTPHLDWLLLTKRPENVMRLAPDFWVAQDNSISIPPNVWIGTTVENQDAANKRIPELLNVNASVLFLSCEPLIGPVKIDDISFRPNENTIWQGNPLRGEFHVNAATKNYTRKIGWVIVGGESGHHARPMNPAWARSIRDQCKISGIPFLFKQWGEYAPLNATSNEWSEYRDDGDKYLTQKNGIVSVRWFGEKFVKGSTIVYRFGKKIAGRLLDGEEHTNFPKPKR